MLSSERSDFASVGRIPVSITSESWRRAAARTRPTYSSSSACMSEKHVPSRTRGDRLASRLKRASSVVNGLSFRSSRTSTATGAGFQASLTRNISCSAPKRRIPDSMCPSSTSRSMASMSRRRRAGEHPDRFGGRLRRKVYAHSISSTGEEGRSQFGIDAARIARAIGTQPLCSPERMGITSGGQRMSGATGCRGLQERGDLPE